MSVFVSLFNESSSEVNAFLYARGKHKKYEVDCCDVNRMLCLLPTLTDRVCRWNHIIIYYMMWSNSVHNLLLHVLCVNNISQWIYSRHFHLYYSCWRFFFFIRLLQPLAHSTLILVWRTYFDCSSSLHPAYRKINVSRCTIKAENCVKCHIRQSIDIVLSTQ